MQSPRLLAAYTAARQARFEHPHAKVTPLQVPASTQEQPGHSPSSMPSGSGVQAPVLTLETALEPRLILRQTFTTFKPQVKGVQKAFLAAKEFVTKPEKWLVFTGPHGCGKTHLVMAITHQCLKDGHQVLSFSEPDLLDALRATFSGSASYRFDDLFSPVQQAAILLLDDVGMQRRTKWVQETMGKLFTYRFEQGLPTVLVIAERQAPDVLPYLQLHQQIRHVQMEGVADYRIFQGRLPRKARKELGPDGGGRV
jgi:chromosomal replication initiation ATPase DnaA